MSYLTMKDQDLKGRKVLIRQDLNVPIRDGQIANDARIVASLPTIQAAVAQGAHVMVMSHLGRPKEGEVNDEYSMKPVADYLSKALNQSVRLIDQPFQTPFEVQAGEVVLFENVRFFAGEKACDESLSRQMAALCDVFVMDAFGTAHRAQASTYGVAKYAAVACAGPLLTAELEALAQATQKPKKPVLAIVGGAKVSTKIAVLESLADQVDQMIVGGGIANTFLLAAGYSVGASLVEASEVELARRLMGAVDIPLPVDVVVAQEFSADAAGVSKPIKGVTEVDMILDVGEQTRAIFAEKIAEAGTIIWNGPVGVFEFPAFEGGSQALAEANSTSYRPQSHP